MARAWKIAARDLSVDFVSPFICGDGQGNEMICSGLLPHFGNAKGAVILGRDDVVPAGIENEFDFVCDLGYWASGLSPFHYETYNRRSFIETLTDWGWYGPADQRPLWFLERGPCDCVVICERCQHLMHLVDEVICSRERPCAACHFANTVPYWTNPAWQRKRKKDAHRRATLK
jgi:hypothetical protein